MSHECSTGTISTLFMLFMLLLDEHLYGESS
jgi:hypothetical protein